MDSLWQQWKHHSKTLKEEVDRFVQKNGKKSGKQGGKEDSEESMMMLQKREEKVDELLGPFVGILASLEDDEREKVRELLVADLQIKRCAVMGLLTGKTHRLDPDPVTAEHRATFESLLGLGCLYATEIESLIYSVKK